MGKLSIRVIIGILFSSVGLVALFISREPLTAAIWLSFGNGLVLSDLRFKEKDANGNVFVKPIPKARTYTALFLFALAILLLLLQIYFDMQEMNGTN